MADEIMTAPEEQALFQLSNGRYIMDEAQSRVMFQIKEAQPEHSHPISGTGYSWDESGMAELFSECYKNDTRYCPEAKSWFTYSEGAWRKDTGSLLVAEKIKEFCRLMALYCGEIANEERRSEYMKFIVKMGDRRFRDRLMKDAASVLPIASAEFDANPYLINCKNGTFDLEKMEFREHDWKDFLTMQTNFNYTLQDARCRRWEKFVAEVTCNDEDKADYLQKALGYSMLGTIVGRGHAVQNLAKYLTLGNATVTVAHSKTKSLLQATMNRDVVIYATPTITKDISYNTRDLVIDLGNSVPHPDRFNCPYVNRIGQLTVSVLLNRFARKEHRA